MTTAAAFEMTAESIGTRFPRLDLAKITGLVGKVYGPVVAAQLVGKLVTVKHIRPNTHNNGYMVTFQIAGAPANGEVTIGIASTAGFAYYTDQAAARAAFEGK